MTDEDDGAAGVAAPHGHADATREEGIPLPVRQSWDAAAAEISNLVFAAPELYERAMTLVRLTADALRADSPDPAALLALADRARDVAALAARQHDIPTAGLRLDLVASVALDLRSREIVEERSRRGRIDRLDQARHDGAPWALIEERGNLDNPLGAPYSRIDVHVASGAALVATAEPDESFTRPVYRLQWAQFDPASGQLRPSADSAATQVEFGDHDAWQAALSDARRRLTQP